MSLKEKVKKFKNDYVIRQVERLDLPDFAGGTVKRYRVRFSGRVQKVGFRLEVQELAVRLGLTGWCENQPNGDVLAEFQGPTERIDFLISFMESLKRVKITDRQVDEVPVRHGEIGFAKR